jgi:hypothetical protein
MTMPNQKTPTWLIERVAQDELSPAEAQEIRQRLAAEGRSLDDELAALRASSREILAQLPRRTMGAAIRRRAAVEPPRRFRLPMLLAPMVLAGSVAAAMVMARGSDGRLVGNTRFSAPEEVTLKGDELRSPRLLVYRQRPGQIPGSTSSARLSDGATAMRGDLLQLAYDKSPEGLYGVLLSVDGAGRVTQHLPEEGARTSAPLMSAREAPLPSAYELDDAPAFERFILITSSQSFAIEAVLDAARALAARGAAAETAALALGPTYRQTSILLHKIGKGAP